MRLKIYNEISRYDPQEFSPEYYEALMRDAFRKQDAPAVRHSFLKYLEAFSGDMKLMQSDIMGTGHFWGIELKSREAFPEDPKFFSDMLNYAIAMGSDDVAETAGFVLKAYKNSKPDNLPVLSVA